MSEREPSGFRCASCDVDFSQHGGLIQTCADLLEAQQRVAELERALSTWREWVEHEYSERRKDKSEYQRGYRDGLDAADTQMDTALDQ